MIFTRSKVLSEWFAAQIFSASTQLGQLVTSAAANIRLQCEACSNALAAHQAAHQTAHAFRRSQFARLVEQLNKQIKSLPFDREALKRMVHAGELCKSKLEYNLEIQAMPVLKSDSGLFEQACHG